MGVPFIAARRAEAIERASKISCPQRVVPIEAAGGEHHAALRADAALATTGGEDDAGDGAVALIEDELRDARIHLDAASGIDAALQQAGHERAALASSVREEPMQQSRRELRGRPDRVMIDIKADHLVIGEEMRQGRSAKPGRKRAEEAPRKRARRDHSAVLLSSMALGHRVGLAREREAQGRMRLEKGEHARSRFDEARPQRLLRLPALRRGGPQIGERLLFAIRNPGFASVMVRRNPDARARTWRSFRRGARSFRA